MKILKCHDLLDEQFNEQIENPTLDDVKEYFNYSLEDILADDHKTLADANLDGWDGRYLKFLDTVKNASTIEEIVNLVNASGFYDWCEYSYVEA